MLEVRNICSVFGERKVLDGVSFSAERGLCILLAGLNGTGKTTLLKILAGIIRPSSGDVIPDGRCIMVPTRIPKIKGFTLREFIATGCYRESLWSGAVSPVLDSKIDESLAALGLEGLAEKDISALSDGEFQKGCLASALCMDASWLLLDEPTAFLDVDARMSVLRCLREIARSRGTGIIFSSHDIAESAPLADRILSLDRRGGFHDSAVEEKSGALRSAFPDYFLTLED